MIMPQTVAYAHIRKVKSPLVIGLTSECRKSRIVGDNGRIVPLKVLHSSSSSSKLNFIYIDIFTYQQIMYFTLI